MSDSTLPLTLFEPATRGALEVNTDADLAALVALSGLPNLTPKRLWSLLSVGHPAEAWALVRAGGAPRTGRTTDAADRWAAWAAAVDPTRLLDEHRSRRVGVHPFGGAGYPSALLDDPEPPALVF